MKKILNTFVVLLILSSLSLQGQTGSLRGKIIDANTGEELPGATVMVDGTTNGTITDFDGNYSLELEPGVYRIRYSYISYQTQLFDSLIINANNVTLNNISLQEATVQLEAVKVVARASRKTEAALQVLQKKSATVIDGISAQQITKLGASNAASALKRVTGVSVEEGKYIYVRGLSDRYSLTTLNGARIPGLDPDKNNVQLDLFPSNIIENLIVHKTFSPDLPGNFTGGYVDIITRDFPEKFTLQFSAATQYNPQANLNKNFLSYPGGKLDFLGYDDGTRSIPEPARGQIPPRFTDNNKLDQITKSFNKIMEPIPKKSFMDQSYAFGMGNRIKLGNKPFGYNLGISYSNKYYFYDNGFTGRYKLSHGADEKLTGQLVLDNDIKGEHRIIWSMLANGNLKISDRHKIGLLIVHNQSGESMTRYQEGIKYSDANDMHYQTRTLQYMQRGFTSGQLKGSHYLEHFFQMKVDWFSAITYSTQEEPDLRFFTNHYTMDNNGFPRYEIAQSLYPVPTRYYRHMDELNLDNNIQAEIPVQWFGKNSKIKAGIDYVYKNRHFTENKFMFNENSNSYAGSVPAYLADTNMDAAAGKLYVTNSIASDEQNSYDGIQNIVSAFAMTDLVLSDKLRLIAGVRMEQGYIETHSLKKDLQAGLLNNLDFLPSFNFTWHPIENMNLRLAYNRTLARPTFRELAPYASLNFVGDYVFIGNDGLKRSLIDNADLRWEYFFKSGEMVSAGTFYKIFHNPIEKTFNTEAANPELTLRNVDEASVAGIEVEVRKKLDFADFLKNFSLGWNISLIKSSVSIDENELQLKREFDPDFPATRVMMGQAPYIINAFLNYSNERIGTDITVSYNRSGKRLYLVNAVGIPDIYQQPRNQLDLTVTQSLSKRFQLRFSARNMLDNHFLAIYPYKGTEYIYQDFTAGRIFSFGIKYFIK